jgi:hypothetical protein
MQINAGFSIRRRTIAATQLRQGFGAACPHSARACASDREASMLSRTAADIIA